MYGTISKANLSDTTGTESWDDTEKLIYSEEVRSLNSVDTGKYTMATKSMNFSPPEGVDVNKEFIIRLAKYSTVNDGQTWLLDTLPRYD